jgi:hypothetical protein
MRLLRLAITLAVATAGFADTITLRSGRVVTGTYLGGTAREVRVDTGDRIQTLNVSDITRIDFSSDGAAPASRPADDGRPTLRRSDVTILRPDSSDDDRPPVRWSDATTLTPDPTQDAGDGRPTLRSSSSAAASSDDDRPTLRRSDGSSSSPVATTSDDGRPTLRRSDSSSSSPAAATSDDDRPVLRRRDGSVVTPDSPAATPAPTPAPAPTAPIELPAGTNLVVRMIDGVNSEVNHVGQTFAGSLDDAVTVNGSPAIPRGADVLVKLVNAKESGTFTGRSELTLSLVSVKVNGRVVDVNTETVSRESEARGKDTATRAAGVGVAGAVVGAIAGGGKGAAVGAAAGGAAGAGSEVITKGPQVKIPSETRLTFVLDTPVKI